MIIKKVGFSLQPHVLFSFVALLIQKLKCFKIKPLIFPLYQDMGEAFYKMK